MLFLLDFLGVFQCLYFSEGMQVFEKECKFLFIGWQQEVDQVKCFGFEVVESIVDCNIFIFFRGELLYFVGINIFMKVFYLEDVN